MLPLLILGLLLNLTARGQQVCDVKESPLGDTYFRKTTPWGQVIDLPCPSGTVFNLVTCGCEKKRCVVLGTDPSAYKEFVDAVGDWVTGQCPGGMVYRDDYCMCTLPRDFSTRRPITTLITVHPQDCPYRSASPTAYQEYFPSIQDWVTNYCPHGTVYIPKYCKCVTQSTLTSNLQSTSTASTITKTPFKPPTNCKYTKDGKSSYKEYIDSLGDWLTYYCSSGEIFSTTWCTCLVEGQTPDYVDVMPPIVPNCKYQPAGLSAYIEYVPEINAWVTNECASKQVYSQAHCSCLNKNLVHVTTAEPKPTSPLVPVTNPNCDLKPAGKNAYQRFEESLQDWVTISCHAGMVFNVLLCHCIQEGVVVTGIPESTTVNNAVTNPHCPYIPVGQRSYKEYVPDLGVWVSNDCPSEMVFDVNMCSCHPDGSAEIIVVPITTVPPLTIPTVPNCPHTKSPDGYNEYIAELAIWINNVCPIDNEFVKLYCTCLSKSDIANIPKDEPSTASSTKTATTSNQSTTSTTIYSTTISTTAETTRSTVQATKYTSTISTLKPPTSTTTAEMRPLTKTTVLKPSTTTKLPIPTSKRSTTPLPTTTVKPEKTTATQKPSTTTTTITTGTTSKLTRTTKKPEAKSTTKKSFETSKSSTTKSTPNLSTTHLLETTQGPSMTTTTSTTTVPTAPFCEKRKSALGERYYEKTVPVWGDLAFMCSTGTIFYLPKCDCVLVSDIPITTVQVSSPNTTTIERTTSSTTTTTTTIPTTTTQPTSMTTTTLSPSTTTMALPPSTTTTFTTSTTTGKATTNKNVTLCPLKPSIHGSEYFKIDLGTFGSVELMCPALQKFDPELCGCYPD